MTLRKNQKNLEDITNRDIEILRELAVQVSEIANLPVHSRTISQWQRNNDLKPGKFMVWINEEPWNEIEQCGEIGYYCENGFAREVEINLRRLLYRWKNFRADMVVEPVYRIPVVVQDTGFGISPEAELSSNKDSGIVSRHFIPQIQDEKDISKIKFPEISVDWDLTEKRRKILQEIFGKNLKVEVYGIGMTWFAPWDWLVMLTGVEEALLALATKPDFVHSLIDHFVNVMLYRLEQFEKLNILSPNNGNFRIGSGGLGYTSELPEMPFSTLGITTKMQWGCSTSQIFSEVSPAMHREFALRYEKRWLEKFGLTYYGCCEPLDKKIHILEEVENLRKISISPRANVKIAAQKIQNRYVFSYKPNPAILACERWDINFVKDDLRKNLEIIKENGCIAEIIMKDISTIRYQVQRLKQWADIAAELTSEFA